MSRPSLCETCQALLPPALLHSTDCADGSGTSCDLPHCDQMSAHIAHWMACPDGLSCGVCRRYTAIVRGHAIDCTDPECGVSSCGAAKTSLFQASLFRASRAGQEEATTAANAAEDPTAPSPEEVSNSEEEESDDDSSDNGDGDDGEGEEPTFVTVTDEGMVFR